jgi:hypothetical protein
VVLSDVHVARPVDVPELVATLAALLPPVAAPDR